MKNKSLPSKALGWLITLVYTGAYGYFLHYYLCAALHLSWEKEWWQAFYPKRLWHFLREEKLFSNAFFHLENLILDRISFAAEEEIEWHYITSEPLEETLPYLIALAVVALAMLFLFVCLFGRGRKAWLLLQLTLLSVPFCFREVPDVFGFFGFGLLCLSAAAAPGLRKRYQHGIHVAGNLAAEGGGGSPDADISERDAGSGLNNMAFGMAGLLVLLSATFLLGSLLLPEGRYLEQEHKIRQAKQDFQRFTEDFANSVRRESHGRLPMEGNREPDPRPELEVSIDRTDGLRLLPIYLKNFAAVHYGKRSWGGYTGKEQARFYTLLQETGLEEAGLQFLAGDMARRTVRYGGMEDVFLEITPLQKVKGRLFTGYGAADSGAGDAIQLPIQDLYMETTGNDVSQRFSYTPMPLFWHYNWIDGMLKNGILPEQLEDIEDLVKNYEAYREFAYETCLEIPEGFDSIKSLAAEALQERMGSNSFISPETLYPLRNEDGGDLDFIMKLEAVKQKLAEYEYTLRPGSVPAGEDFVQYFLMENQKGYCVHFASAAVLMLRSLGIPARYAEGYIIRKQDVAAGRLSMASTGPQATVTVTGDSAHAWAEIWVEGVGFIPYEFTPGFDVDNVALFPNSINSGQDAADMPEQGADLNQPEEDEPEQKEEDPEQAELEEDKPEAGQDGSTGGEYAWRRWLLYAAAFLGLILAVAAAAYTGIRLHRYWYSKKSPAEKLLYQYRTACRIYRRAKLLPENFEDTYGRRKAAAAFAKAERQAAQPSGRLYPLVLRARFSAQEPTGQEVEFAEEYTHSLRRWFRGHSNGFKDLP